MPQAARLPHVPRDREVPSPRVVRAEVRKLNVGCNAVSQLARPLGHGHAETDSKDGASMQAETNEARPGRLRQEVLEGGPGEEFTTY